MVLINQSDPPPNSAATSIKAPLTPTALVPPTAASGSMVIRPSAVPIQHVTVFPRRPVPTPAARLAPVVRRTRMAAPADVPYAFSSKVTLDSNALPSGSRSVFKLSHRGTAAAPAHGMPASRSMPGLLRRSTLEAPSDAAHASLAAVDAAPSSALGGSRPRPAAATAVAPPSPALPGSPTSPMADRPLSPPPPAPTLGRSAPSAGLPLMRGREKLALLRHSPLFSLIGESALIELCAHAEEREIGRYKSVRPSLSIFVLAYGALELQQASASLCAEAPHELVITAPSVPVAVAATAVALDCGVAGEASVPGATLGLSNLVGGLTSTTASFFVTEGPALLLSLPLEAVRAALPAAACEDVASEARLRMLLKLKAFRDCSAPVPQLRALGAAMALRAVPPGTTLSRAGDASPDASLMLLLHGRVDLRDRHEKVVQTVDGSMPPPLAQPPHAAAPRQRFTAVTADDCLVLFGGSQAADALASILAAPAHGGAHDAAAHDERVAEAAGPPPPVGAAGASKTGMSMLQALEAMRAQAQAGTPGAS